VWITWLRSTWREASSPSSEQLSPSCRARLADYTPGDPLDPDSGMGALISEKHLGRVLEYIALGQEAGELVAGGRRLTGRGYFVEPTIFARVDNDSRIAQSEVFGPVLAVIPFDGSSILTGHYRFPAGIRRDRRVQCNRTRRR
jgi:gamma-glutamyl-gamma-aminobutyraldehyde dehydrogenase